VRPLLFACALAVAAAAHAEAPLAAIASPPPAEAVHRREFESDDPTLAARVAVATLQDLGLALEAADAASGTIVASKLDDHALRLRVTLRPASATQIGVEVRVEYGERPIGDPGPAEHFFSAYERALFPTPELSE
jgi:hypothetical protein